ncbi:MAG: hypothetical protein AAGA30_15960, partial [Planctomycetota bacterium]
CNRFERYIAVSDGDIGEVLDALQRHTEANEAFQKSMAGFRRLAFRNDTDAYAQWDLAVSQQKYSIHLYNTGSPEDAVKSHRKISRMLEEMIQSRQMVGEATSLFERIKLEIEAFQAER